jgi:5-methylcytosine-specific restriction protein B
VELQYSHGEPFSLPDNLVVIGTMNTADRSIALVDSALRRRFYFQGLLPTQPPVSGVLREWLARKQLEPDAADLLDELNRTIDDEDFSIGPSYFITRDGRAPDLEQVWRHALMPLLREHFYERGARDVEAQFGLEAIRTSLERAADDRVGPAAADGPA